MKFHSTLYSNFLIICMLFLWVLIPLNLKAQVKTEKSGQAVKISLNVTDDNGNPVKNAQITIGNITLDEVTDERGQCSILAGPNDIVMVSSPGYERIVSSGQDLINDNKVILIKSLLFAGSDDNVPLPYMTINKRHATGSYNVLKGDDLMRYPSTDIRLSFAGIVPGLTVTERNGAPGAHPAEVRSLYGITEKVSITARGRGLTYVVDGVQTNITEIQLNPEEIETVTVVKDIVGKTMYGPLAANGIMFIQTKRGNPGERYMNVNIESGTSIIDRFPEWVTGVDYAKLNNTAREGSGLLPLYSQADIAGYAKNDPYDLKYPNINFRDYMLKKSREFTRINVAARGGGKSAQYSSYLGYNREGDIFGIGSTADFNRINLRSNVDVNVNNFISVGLDINGALGIRRTPNYGYTTSEGQTMMGIYEFNTALPNILRTPPIEFPVYANNDPELVTPWFGMTSRYGNPVGSILKSGSYTEQNRQAGVKSKIEFDLSHLILGLKSTTTIAFDVLNLIRIGQGNQYEGYRVTVEGTDTSFVRVQTGIVDDIRRKLHDYYYIRNVFSQNFGYERTFGNHDIQSSLTYFMFRKFTDGIRDPQPQLLGVWSGKYTYNDKYTLHGVLNYAHTYSFLNKNRGSLFPALGASWLISEEDFLSGSNFINFLKLRAEAGVNGFDPYSDPHIVRSRFVLTTRSNFGPHELNRWFGTTEEATPPSSYASWVGNPNLTWEKRKEFNFGLDGFFFDKIYLEFNYFNTLRDGIIGRLSNSYPDVAGMSAALPYFNGNIFRSTGIETGLQWSDKTGELEWSVGGNATFQKTVYEKYDEPNYRNDYQKRTGKETGTYWGLHYLGRFNSDEETLIIPQLFDPVLNKGDFKYKDMNNDGVIDENDYSAIGNTSPKMIYGLNLNLKYKNFGFTAIGIGAAFFDFPMTSVYFQNGWGDNNYSVYVRDNVGTENYPRLTYERVNNNYVASDFWLTKGNWFKIKNVELSYTIPGSNLKMINSRGIRIFARGANLLTLSKIKDVDPESSVSGISSYPLNKTFTGGILLTF